MSERAERAILDASESALFVRALQGGDAKGRAAPIPTAGGAEGLIVTTRLRDPREPIYRPVLYLVLDCTKTFFLAFIKRQIYIYIYLFRFKCNECTPSSAIKNRLKAAFRYPLPVLKICT